jgi:hypothetical protein
MSNRDSLNIAAEPVFSVQEISVASIFGAADLDMALL